MLKDTIYSNMSNPQDCLEDFKQTYTNIGHPISFSGVSKVFDFYNRILDKKKHLKNF